MNELTITILRLGYLFILWMLVLMVVRVLREDLYGTRILPRRFGRSGPKKTPVNMDTESDTYQDKQRPKRLIVTDGPLKGTALPLTGSVIMIGRAPSCTLVLDDDYSSSRHARIFLSANGWMLEDLGSTNGTFLGTQKVSSPVPLLPGMPVRVGQTVLELQR